MLNLEQGSKQDPIGIVCYQLADPQHASISKHISEITKVINIMQQTIKL